MAIFTNRVYDSAEGTLVRWTSAIADVAGISYPFTFGDASDFCIESILADGGITDHDQLLGLAQDDHTQYPLLVGRIGGQTLTGGTTASQNLILKSTAHATQGVVRLFSGSNLDLNSNDIINVDDIAAATGSFSGVLAGNGGAVLTRTAVGVVLDTRNTWGDAVALAELNTTATSGGNAAYNGLLNIYVGKRDPNSALTGIPGSFYYRADAATPNNSTIYVKTTATGTTTGWVSLRSTATPAGADTQIQFNNAGAFGASANLVWTGAALNLTGNLTASGAVAGNGGFQVNASGVVVVGLAASTANGEGTGIMTLATNVGGGSNGGVAQVFVGSRDPNTLPVSAVPGSLFVRSSLTGSTLYVNVSAGSPGTTWVTWSVGAYTISLDLATAVFDTINGISVNPVPASRGVSHAVLAYPDSGTGASVAAWQLALPNVYIPGAPITVKVYWTATATTGGVVWTGAIERNNAGLDVDTDSFATGVTSAVVGPPSSAGVLVVTSLVFSGASLDGLTAGDPFRLMLSREADGVNDILVGNADVLRVVVSN